MSTLVGGLREVASICRGRGGELETKCRAKLSRYNIAYVLIIVMIASVCVCVCRKNHNWTGTGSKKTKDWNMSLHSSGRMGQCAVYIYMVHSTL